MADLPAVVLRLVLVHVKLNGSDTQRRDLLACSLVNKAWHHASTPCLYGIIALDIPRLGSFTQSVSAGKYAPSILSLTLRMERDAELCRHPSGEQVPHPTLSQRLRHLVPLLSQMTNLNAFSFYSPRNPVCFVPRREIIDLLDALPARCTSMELDTGGNDRRDKIKEPQETTHVCVALRRVLPQMQYVRIRTAAMCWSMFGKRDRKEMNTPAPLCLPKLRGMIINCSPSLARCSPDDWFGSRAYQSSNLAWHPVTEALADIVDSGLRRRESEDERTEGWLKNPDGVTISVMETTDHSNDDTSIWRAKVRADMIRKQSWAMPTRSVWHEATIPGSGLIRMPDGEDWMGTPVVLERLAEGENVTWFNLLSGARLPRRIIVAGNGNGDDFTIRDPTSTIGEMSGGWAGVLPDPTPLRTPEEWRRENPRKMTYVWRNERNTGTRLIGAEKRVGEHRYLSLEPMVEITPQGWRRSGFQNDSLVPEESEVS